MLNILSITIKNFFSIGQVAQTITLDGAKTTLVLGNDYDNDEGSRNGIGKAQPHTSSIRIPNGWVKMKDISVGDLICTPSDTHSVVVGKFPQGTKKVYNIVMDDGRKTQACLDHLWKITNNDGTIEIVDTRKILEKKKNGESVYIEVLDEVYDHETIQPIHPYLMGTILAKGRVENDDVKIKNVDRRIIDRIRSSTNNVIVHQKGMETYLKTKLKNKSLGKILSEFKLYLDDEIRIPDEYMHGSYNQKLELVRGIFDNIGEKNEDRSTVLFSENQKRFSLDFQNLIRSLGGLCQVKYTIYGMSQQSQSFFEDQKDIVVDCKFKNNNDLFTLEEKKDYLLNHKLYYKVKTIEYCGEEECSCIKIADDNELYLTDGYITTHNTTIVNAISYSLFGKTISPIKRQDAIVNYKNKKNMLVTIEFTVNGQYYKIERGRKPNILKFIRYDNDSEVDILNSLGENADTQRFIEQTIGITDSVFRQIILMNTYSKSFMDSPAAKQREIIEEILGINVLSKKAEVIADKIKELKNDFDKESVRIETLIESNKRIERNIQQLVTKRDDWNNQHEKKFNDLRQSLEDLQQIDIKQEIDNHDYNKDLDETLSKIDYIEKEISANKKLRENSIQTLYRYNEQLESFEKNVCPTCDQTIEDGSHEKHIENLKNDIQRVLKEVDEHDKNLKEYQEVIDSVSDYKNMDKKPTYYRNIKDAYNHETLIKNIEDNIEQLKQEYNPYESQINELKSGETGIQELDYTNYEKLEKELKHSKFLQKLLTNRDSFIRKRIIDQSLPYLNKRLPIYLENLALRHRIEFDSDLTFSIEDMGEEVDFGNLSRGEQNRVIIALNLAFRDLYENLVGPINILFIDELLDFGIDTIGAINGIKLLKSLNRDKGKSVFLITHKEELQEYVEDVLFVKKEGGFTTFEAM